MRKMQNKKQNHKNEKQEKENKKQKMNTSDTRAPQPRERSVRKNDLIPGNTM